VIHGLGLGILYYLDLVGLRMRNLTKIIHTDKMLNHHEKFIM